MARLDATHIQLLKQGRGEMKSGGGGGHRPLGPGIDCLVILRIPCLDGAELADIGRQRHRAFAVQGGHEGEAAPVEAQQNVPGGRFFQHLGRQIFPKLDAIAQYQSPARLGEGQPAPLTGALVQCHLHGDLGAPGSGSAALELGGDDPGIVEDHEIARPQDRRQLAHLAVFEPVGTHHEQPCRVARACRISGDQPLRQLEVEIG